MATITKKGITLSTDRGNGDATITVTATENTSKYPRVAYFTVSTKTGLAMQLKVTQLGTLANNIGNDTETNL